MPLGQNKGMIGFHGSEDWREISSTFISRPFSKILWVCSIRVPQPCGAGLRVAMHYTAGCRAVCIVSVYCLESSLCLIPTEKSGANAERLHRIIIEL